MKKIRVCHMTSAHESSDVRIFHKECTSLAKRKEYEVFLVAKGNDRKENNVNVIGIDNYGMGRIGRMLLFSRKIYKKSLAVDADVYHLHDPELLVYALKLKKKGKVVIFDSHEDTYQQILIKEYIPSVFRKIIGKVYYKYETYVCKKIDAVIFPCTVDKKHPFENRAKKFVFINNYPVMNDYCCNKSDALKMCYVGSLSEKRGVTTLLEAYKLFNAKVPLILVGKFESEKYMQELKNKGLLENVDYRGQCTPKEVLNIYREAHIGISNLHNLGQYPKLGTFPTKVYEYMANKLAIIVSEYPFSKEVLRENFLGILIEPSCPASICDAMNLMCSNHKLIKEMGMNGYNLVKRRFNWEKESEKLIALYEEVISEA